MIAISTAYKKALVAVEIEGKKAFRELDANCKHSENLLPAIDSALQEVEKTLAQNDKFAVVIGPGSFTGLRISAALVKGFLAGEEKKNVLPLTTFELMAYSYIKNFAPKEDFVCIINGLSGYYFVCKFDCKGNKLSAEEMITKEALEKFQNTKVCLAEEKLTTVMVDPTAEELLALINEEFFGKEYISAGEIMPLYLRKSQAEDALEEKQKK